MAVTQAHFSRLARFVNQSSHYSKAGKRLKVGVLKLRMNEPGLSVWGIAELSIHDIEEIGSSILTDGRHAHGYGEFSPEDFIEEKLSIDTTTGEPRHADIVNWPEDEEERTEIATSLAFKSRLVLFEK